MSAPDTDIRNRRVIEPIYSEIGQRIQHCCDLAGMTQHQLAVKIGQTRASVSNMIADQQRVPLHVVKDIADALKMKPSQFMRGIWA